jgi:RHS repeat-associated protein
LPEQVISSNRPGLWFAYDQAKTGWPLQTAKLGSSTATPTTHYADAKGRDTLVVDPGGHWTKSYYASSGFQNTDSVRSPNGTLTRIGRDGWGRVISTTNPYGDSTVASLDTLNRPRWIAHPAAGDTTRFQYDLLNNVRSVTDAKGQVYSYQVNALGWVTKAVSPGASAGDSTAYDVAGNATYVRTRAGRQVSLLYDALGRVTKRIGLGAADTITYTYAPDLRWVKATTVSGGIFVSRDSISTDSVGRKIQEAAYRPAGSYVQQNAFQADKPDRISTSLNDNGPGYALQYSYDATKRLSQIGVNFAGTSTIGYDGDNLPTTIQLPSGLTQTTSFTSSHMLARRQYNVQAVQDSLGRAYRTDSLGRLVARYNGDSTKYQTFAYNTANRLASWEKRHRTGTISCASQGDWGYDCNGISVGDLSEGFYYDLVGNPNDASVNLATGSNRLLSYRGVSMLYDADGNIVRRTVGTTTDSLLWDDFGQLKEVRRNGATIATFAYDGFGRRTRKTAGGTTTQYIWDGDQLRAEANGADTTTQRYSYYPGIDQLHAVTKNGVTYYASIEPSTGDVIGLINGSTNAVVATYNYTPWGEIESSSQTVSGLNSLRWKGLLYDLETGLYYMRARYYDPQVRRFISEDPIGLAGGINTYAFGGGDPVNRIDPSGTCSYDEWQVNNDGSEEPGSRQTFTVTPGASVWLNGTHTGVWYCGCDNETWQSSPPPNGCGSQEAMEMWTGGGPRPRLNTPEHPGRMPKGPLQKCDDAKFVGSSGTIHVKHDATSGNLQWGVQMNTIWFQWGPWAYMEFVNGAPVTGNPRKWRNILHGSVDSKNLVSGGIFQLVIIHEDWLGFTHTSVPNACIIP